MPQKKAFYLKVLYFEPSVSSGQFLFIQKEIFISDVYSSFKKFPSNCSGFVLWFSIVLLIFFLKFLKSKELLNGMIGLTSSSQVAITIITNFPCLLMFSFQYTAFFFNIFDTSAYINLFLSVHCQFLISNCFLKKYVSGYHTFYYVLSQGLVCTLYDGGKLESCQKLLENSWNLSGKNEWPPSVFVILKFKGFFYNCTFCFFTFIIIIF